MTVIQISGGYHYSGLKGDTKPTTAVPAGSIFWELSSTAGTVKRYVYSGSVWGQDVSQTTVAINVSSIDDVVDGLADVVRKVDDLEDNALSALSDLQSDVTTIKTDVATIKSDVAIIKADVAEIKAAVVST